MGVEALKHMLRDDDIFARYRSIRQTAEQKLPYEQLCDELESIQQSRLARTSAHNMQPRQVLNVSLDEVSHRARLTEILVQAKRVRSDISAVVDGLWHHISSTYDEELRDLKTKDQRSSAVATVLNKGYTFVSTLDSLIDQCETVIKEIDQTSFALSRVASLMELVIRREQLSNVDI